MPTLAELPVTGGVSAKAVNAAIALTSARSKVQRFVEAAHYAQRCQDALARQEAEARLSASPAEALKQALRCLFMTTTAYFCDHLASPMPDQIRSALSRVYQASQGGRVNGKDILDDLRQLGACEAICEPTVEQALVVAEQALLSMKIG
jgi:hypothetical protein